jgi:antitoxin component YwqK of YwqJK toxin-antitoxin module
MKNDWIIFGSNSGIAKALIKSLSENSENRVFCVSRKPESVVDGKNVFYYPNGVTAAVGYYKNGYKTGPWIYRDKTGKVKEKELYKAGGEVGEARAIGHNRAHERARCCGFR